ncbi:MAG: PAS domain S-box protein [Desulfomonilaceae bacterium]
MPNCLRVLVVEDSEDDTLLMINELEVAGFNVAYKRVDMADAMVDALSAHPWDIILADYRMPHFSANAALKLVRDDNQDIPFILVSGKIGEETAVEAMKAGAHDYVMKDNLARLAPAVERELREVEIRRKRRIADEALHKSEVRFRQIYDNAPVMMHSIDKNGVIRNLNRKWLAEMGYARDEMIGRSVAEVMTPKSVEALWQILPNFWQDRKVADLSYQYIKKDGTIIDVLLDSVVIDDPIWGEVSLSVVRNVTAQKHAEVALRDSEKRFRALFEQAAVGVALIDSKTGQFAKINQRYCDIVGYTGKEMGELTFQNITHPEDVETDLKNMELLRQGKITESSVEKRYYHKNGETVWVNLTISPLWAFGEEPNYHIAVVQDITERKRAEEALRESEQRFRAIFESAQDCIFIRDASLRYTHVNPYAEKILGLPASRVIGRTSHDLYPPEQAASTEDINRRVLSGEAVERKHVLTLNGVDLKFHTILVPLHNSEGEITGVCGISREISALQKIEFPISEHSGQYPSKTMRLALRKANLAAGMDSTVLLLGESGSGKDHLARYIHNRSKRADGPYFAINCAAIAPELAESELFGHERGAFTGAIARKRGLLELAEGGSLLLNEIADLSLPLQAKLLTFLDTRRFTRVGGEKEISVNARLMAATNKDLEKEIEKGTFRKDLFFRLHVMPVTVPPLRDRREDIPILVNELLSKLRIDMQLPDLPAVDGASLQALQQYSWPGNVRELRNVLERALILCEGEKINLSPLSLQTADNELSHDWSFNISFPSGKSITEVFDDLKQALAAEALRRCYGSRKKAASLLGISRDSFYRYLKNGNTN